MLPTSVLAVGLAAAWKPSGSMAVRRAPPRVKAPVLIEGYQNGCKEPDEDLEVDPRVALERTLDRESLKTSLLRTCAACARGFGASPSDRRRVDAIIEKLSLMPPDAGPTRGLAGSDGTLWAGRGFEGAQGGPLEGRWRLIYTDASDVLGLDINPFVGVGSVWQEISLPSTVDNVIELFPRAEALLPAGMRSAVTLRVGTRAAARSATRVGLTFERVALRGKSIFGFDVSSLLPPLSAPLPRVPGAGGADTEASPAFFDILYLDAELLLIRQNSPGGVFAAVRETVEEAMERQG